MDIFLVIGTVLVILLVLFVIKIVFMPQGETAEYDKKLIFAIGKVLHFPDFDLTFTGKREQQPVGNLHLAPVYEFKISSQGPRKMVEWSAGTGAFGPSDFTVNGQVFLLEMKDSLTLGKLENDMLVIRKAE